jgi:hypothetical protein
MVVFVAVRLFNGTGGYRRRPRSKTISLWYRPASSALLTFFNNTSEKGHSSNLLPAHML